MKSNRSLELTIKLKEELKKDLTGFLSDLYPNDIINTYRDDSHKRSRVYDTSTTAFLMIATMLQDDKSLKNTVSFYSLLHLSMADKIKSEEEKLCREYEVKNKGQKKTGRPRERHLSMAKSKTEAVSVNTSAYAQARKRVGADYFQLLFEDSADFSSIAPSRVWHGMTSFLADGTYLQMQDTAEIREEFQSSKTGSYPRGLLLVMTEQGAGKVHSYSLSSDKKSEIEIMYSMIGKMPKGSLVLYDDLLNCYEIFSELERNSVRVIVPGKRKRNYTVIKEISPGDDLVEIYAPLKKKWTPEGAELKSSLNLRRIEYKDPYGSGNPRVLYTNILDESIGKEEVILKYVNRWDIEINIREVKQILGIAVLRSKSPGMARKELAAGLTAYNYLRKIIAKSSACSDFPPKGDLIQRYYEMGENIHMDKLGRVYAKWSPGRHRGRRDYNVKIQDAAKAGAVIS